MEPTITLDKLTAADFEPLVGQGFRLAVPELPWTLKLQSVAVPRSRSPSPLAGRFRTPFTLVLEADAGLPKLRTMILPFELDGLGRLDLFTDCCGVKPDGGFLYQINFN